MKALANNYDTDLLIVGGSTAGLATAIYARLAGLRCILVEPRSGPLEKSCGEGFMPSALALLQELGISSSLAQPIKGISYHGSNKLAYCPFPDGQGGGIRRSILSAAMTGRAQELGVPILRQRLASFTDHGSWVEACGIRARWLVGCDGLRSTVCRSLGLGKAPLRPHRFGIRQHFAVDHCPDRVNVYWQDGYEVYVTPTGPQQINIAVLFSDPAPRFEACLAAIPELAACLGEPLSRKLGAGPFEHRVRSPMHGNCFLVGDAAGFLDPITGEGNQLALAAARELIDCLARGAPQEYPKRWRAMIRAYWHLTSALLWVSRQPLLRPNIVPLTAMNPRLFTWALSALAYKPTKGDFLVRQALEPSSSMLM